jgi:predicted methyltransferase
MKSLGLVLVAGLSLAAINAAMADDVVAPYITAAIADPGRAADTKADARRHAAELAAFAQVKPGDTVVDLIPGGGYFTRIFSKIVGPKGHVYAVWPSEYAKEDDDETPLIAALAKDPQYANVTVITQPAAQFAIPLKADVVWTSQNYHDYPDKFMGPADTKVLDAQVFAALKPGGVFIVIDHAAETGSGKRDTDTLHRIDEQVVKSEVPAAGFTLEAESNILRNADDTHKIRVFDAPVRGHTDQFALRFRKPA